MYLYLVRHAQAVDASNDRQRKLTPLGRRDTRALAKLLHDMRLDAAAVWHSGIVRAVQTAQPLAAALLRPRTPRRRAGLEPDDPVKPIAAALAAMTADLMIVGHEPFLGKLASKLLVGDKSWQLFALAKPSILCLQGQGDEWEVAWMLSPRVWSRR